ncbi:MAG: DUF72 domain-containing protein, partial [Kiritimatiellae bacterium]|nr:DUF72 domain-containing protein [Kiritimatiellia bacterium]
SRLTSDLTSPARSYYISTMKALIQTGSSGRVPVPPEKRFLINRYDFKDTPETRGHLEKIREHFGGLGTLVLELRHGSWQRQEALAWLEKLDVTVANLDYPTAADSFTLPVCTVGNDAYFRLHGRNFKAWFDAESGRDETYNYLYESKELDEIRGRIHKIKAAAKSLTVVTNNHYQGREVVNALQLKAKEKGGRIPVPPALLMRYPILKDIADSRIGLW